MALTQVTKEVLHSNQSNITVVGTLESLTVSGNTATGNLSATGTMVQNGITGGIVPVGAIVMWSGAIADLPTGWAFCDGTNGTPDLRNTFIIGASADSGGQANTTVTGSTTKTGGSANAIVVSHSHTATVTDPGHRHTVGGAYGGTPGGGGIVQSTAQGEVYSTTETTGITVAISTTGSNGTNANLPPYYALAFIMRTS